MAPYMEQSMVYNAWNFKFGWEGPYNSTVAGVGIASLWCPSDTATAPVMLDTGTSSQFYGVNSSVKQSFPSYAGCEGTWPQYVGPE